MQVRATKLGYYRGLRNPGAVFDYPDCDISKSTWLVSADKPVPVVAPKEEKPVPTTLSELAKAAPNGLI